jgi:hypothetical protein
MAAPGLRSPARRPADFAIDGEGIWLYRGSPIRREPLVRLLAGMLARQGDSFVLLTPEQALRVDVADAPFLITDCDAVEADGQRCIWLSSSLGERIPLDAEHPLTMRNSPDGQLKAYVRLRDGLDAMLHRNVFYRLAEIATSPEVYGRHGLSSCGLFFPLE